MNTPYCFRSVGCIALAFAMVLTLSCSLEKRGLRVERIYRGGPIITVDENNPIAEAVAVGDGRIIAVGVEAEVLALAGEKTEIVDLAGRTLVPGFIDAHCHFLGFGAQAVGANLLAPPDGGVETIDDLVEELRAFAEGPDVDRAGWIFGLGYDDAVLAEGRHPTRDDLDRVSTDVPVMAVHISGHFSAVNSAGLREIGIDAETEDPEGGVIRRRRGSREPNGVLEELASIPHMMRVLSPSDEDDQAYYLKRGEEMAKSFGYTTVQEGRALAAGHAILERYADKHGFEIDVVSYIDYSAKEILYSSRYDSHYKNRYRVAGLKITLDGSPQGRTAWRTIPYRLPPDGQDGDYRGYPAIPDSAVVESLFEEAYENGWQVLTHANGDAAIDQFVAAVRSVDKNTMLQIADTC